MIANYACKGETDVLMNMKVAKELIKRALKGSRREDRIIKASGEHLEEAIDRMNELFGITESETKVINDRALEKTIEAEVRAYKEDELQLAMDWNKSRQERPTNFAHEEGSELKEGANEGKIHLGCEECR